MRDWKDGACDDLCAFKSNILLVQRLQPIKVLLCDGLSWFDVSATKIVWS